MRAAERSGEAWTLRRGLSVSLRDVIQSLVDDDLVFKDKIGTSVYFWSLPCRAGNQDERQAALAELSAMEKKHRELQEEINKYADNDPTGYESMRNASKIAHESANRWTDNIFALQKWIFKRFPEARDKHEELYKKVGITEDFDYVE